MATISPDARAGATAVWSSTISRRASSTKRRRRHSAPGCLPTACRRSRRCSRSRRRSPAGSRVSGRSGPATGSTFTEKLVIKVSGFKPGTPLVLFAIQKPNAPFGIGWYEGDVAIGAKGSVTEAFISRFNIETFATAIGQAQAPKTHPADGTKNPVFKPIHTYHLGVWFDSVEAAVANGCPPNETVFNGDHTAGPQVLNTGTFPDLN